MPSTKVDLFVEVPNENIEGIPWQTLHFYSYLRAKSRKEKSNGLWINIPSKTLRKKYGADSSKRIRQAISLGWVDVNSRYSDGKIGKSFTKSYRISDRCFLSKHKIHTIQLQKRVFKKLAPKAMMDHSVLDSSYAELLKKHHDTLRIETARSKAGKVLKQKLDLHIADIKVTTNDRVYSTILLSKKKARKYVIFGNRGKLVNIDASAMVQQLLNREVKDEIWDQMITEDFPTVLKRKIGLVGTRKKIKQYFMAAISRGVPKHPDARLIRDYLHRHFPKIMTKVNEMNRKGTVQAATQSEESLLIQRFIMANQEIPMIPANDGVFCGERDDEIVKARLEQFLRNAGLNGKTNVNVYGKAEKPINLIEFLS